MNELREIIGAKKVVDEILVANTDAIKRIDREILELTKTKEVTKDLKHDLKHTTKETTVKALIRQDKKTKCKYFNGGYCKYKAKCRFVHPEHICKEHMEGKRCSKDDCSDRHPKRCKWLSCKGGCKRHGCEYFHGTLADDDERGNREQHFKCASCKSMWTDRSCVLEYSIHNQKVHFCLNCDDWVKHKENVFDAGWTLLDSDGYLRTGI